MKVYLIQHAKPKPKEEDPERPLSEEGRNDATRVADSLKQVSIKKILHSGKLRAQQTAEILARSLDAEVVKAQDLEPLADPQIWATKLDGESEDVMLVGHLPHLDKLASLLLCGNADRQIVGFKQGCIVCLEKSEIWSVAWMFVPDFLP